MNTNLAVSPEAQAIEQLKDEVLSLAKETLRHLNAAKTGIGIPESDDDFRAFQNCVEFESKKASDLELRIAVTAPISSGKSTLINGIAGFHVLPTDKAATTVIPTEIAPRASLMRPSLELPVNLKDWLSELTSRVNASSSIVQSSLSRQEALALREINTNPMPWSGTEGETQISHTLGLINALARVWLKNDEHAESLKFPDELPRVLVPIIELSDFDLSRMPGGLVFVDTPGPDIAKFSEKMLEIVGRQVAISSLVLIVVDYGKLGSEASANINEFVGEFGKFDLSDNVYFALNKIDEVREGESSIEDAVRSLCSSLHMDRFTLGEDRVFPVSARLASVYRGVLNCQGQEGSDSLVDCQAAREAARILFGVEWESSLRQISEIDFKEQAHRFLWQGSRFPHFLRYIYSEILGYAAPISLYSILKSLEEILQRLQNEIQCRCDTLVSEIGSLRGNIDDITKKESSLRQAMEGIQRLKADGFADAVSKLTGLGGLEIQFDIPSYLARRNIKRAHEGTWLFTNEDVAMEFRGLVIDALDDLLEAESLRLSVEISGIVGALAQGLLKTIPDIRDVAVESCEDSSSEVPDISLFSRWHSPKSNMRVLPSELVIASRSYEIELSAGSDSEFELVPPFEAANYLAQISEAVKLAQSLGVPINAQALNDLRDSNGNRIIFNVIGEQVAVYRLKAASPPEKETRVEYRIAFENISSIVVERLDALKELLVGEALRYIDEIREEAEEVLLCFYRLIDGCLSDIPKRKEVLYTTLHSNEELLEISSSIADKVEGVFGRLRSSRCAIDGLVGKGEVRIGEAGRRFKFDVALSFAGEDRGLAEDIAWKLRESGVSVFYDQFEEGNIWGRDMVEVLSEVYYQRARYCLMFLSEHYLKKPWPRLERQIAQLRAALGGSEYILPLRLDSCSIPPQLSKLIWIDVDHSSIGVVINRILGKLQGESNSIGA